MPQNQAGNPDNYRGCLLGGAVGDALGAPVEFMRLHEIRSAFGRKGITDFAEAYGRKGAITDDTQMTLFTAEGLLRALHRFNNRGLCSITDVVTHAYIRWLVTQGVKPAGEVYRTVHAVEHDGFLIQVKELHERRAPGNTCLSALQERSNGNTKKYINNSKGCGGVMRMAPVGLFAHKGNNVFGRGCALAQITHGHPSGYLAAGCFARIIAGIIEGNSLDEAVKKSVRALKKRKGHEECLKAVERALTFSQDEKPCPETIERIGAGWIAEEALAIALYCSRVFQDDFRKAVLLAVNHSGDSDSTGAMTGTIVGALLGVKAIPQEWLSQLELCNVISEVAEDLLTGYREDDTWYKKYPCW